MIKILIAGDFVPRERTVAQIEKGDYSCLDEVKPLIQEVNYAIVNFESPVVKRVAKPIKKVGPNLRCTEEAMACLAQAGFKCVTLANNHFRDYGQIGVEDTLDACRKYGIDHVGGGNNITDAQQILIKDIDGQRLAIVNVCENEWSIASENNGGSAPLNPVQNYYAVQKARKRADYVLVIVHGGHELFQLPSPRMVETYRFFIDSGADAVVNHHQHCYSGYEIYHGKPIFYGLGNFCFDRKGQRNTIWNDGYMVTIGFSFDKSLFSIHPYRQCNIKPCVEMLPPNAFDEKLKKLNDIIKESFVLQNAVNKYYDQCVDRYSNIFEPIRNRYFLAAKRRGWLPSLISKKRKLEASNYIQCEAHRDKLLHWLE